MDWIKGNPDLSNVTWSTCAKHLFLAVNFECLNDIPDLPYYQTYHPYYDSIMTASDGFNLDFLHEQRTDIKYEKQILYTFMDDFFQTVNVQFAQIKILELRLLRYSGNTNQYNNLGAN